MSTPTRDQIQSDATARLAALKSKPGPRTTEFWLTLAVVLGSLTAAALEALSPTAAATVTTVVVALYNVSRAVAKS